MRKLFLPLLMALLVGCETVQHANSPKQIPTGIVFDTSDVLYTGGLGAVGIEGFCKRVGNQVVEKFRETGIENVTNSPPSADQAKITITLSAIEGVGGAGLDLLVGAYGTQKIRVRYAAYLDSPAGLTLATWKHEVEEDSVDRLTIHMASDIVKYLKDGFR